MVGYKFSLNILLVGLPSIKSFDNKDLLRSFFRGYHFKEVFRRPIISFKLVKSCLQLSFPGALNFINFQIVLDFVSLGTKFLIDRVELELLADLFKFLLDCFMFSTLD